MQHYWTLNVATLIIEGVVLPYLASLLAGNLLLVIKIIQRFTFQTVGNATFSVDSFFFLR